MARRMFSEKIIESDAFMEMSPSAQCLYFHLNMAADDDGFINRPNSIKRMCGASDEDMDALISNGYIIRFDSGVVVIVHWKLHNYIPKDRYKPTDYQTELHMLEHSNSNGYSLLYTDCIQNVSMLDTSSADSVYLGKDRLGKDRIDIDNVVQDTTLSLPTEQEDAMPEKDVAEVVDYLNVKTGCRYKSDNKLTVNLLNARYRDGARLDDFKKVIDNMTHLWLKDPKMKMYLRPKTLFGSKFEGYLNANINVRGAPATTDKFRNFDSGEEVDYDTLMPKVVSIKKA